MMEQDGPVKSRTEAPLPQLAVFQIQQRISDGIQDMKAIHFGGVGEDVLQNADFLQNTHAGGLEKESRAHRFASVRAFEEDDFVTLPTQ